MDTLLTQTRMTWAPRPEDLARETLTVEDVIVRWRRSQDAQRQDAQRRDAQPVPAQAEPLLAPGELHGVMPMTVRGRRRRSGPRAG